jgi:hypothetical protein
MAEESNGVQQKALKINLDARKFGTLAEIGAGQEVARWFFHVGKAAGTVAKSISAYDMAVSDSLYGHAGHYVSRERLESMLDTEFKRLVEHLDQARGLRPLIRIPSARRGAPGWAPGSRPNPGANRRRLLSTPRCWIPSSPASRKRSGWPAST